MTARCFCAWSEGRAGGRRLFALRRVPGILLLFAGAAFKLLKGKGLNLSKAIYPYFVGQMLLPDPGLRKSSSTLQCKLLSAGGGIEYDDG